MQVNTAFLLGWSDGAKARRPVSRRMVERRYAGLAPDVIEAYINGHDDALRGDRFRYFLALRDDTPSSVLSVDWD